MKAFDDLMAIVRLEPVATRTAAMRDWLRMYVQHSSQISALDKLHFELAKVDLKAVEEARLRKGIAASLAAQCEFSGWAPDEVTPQILVNRAELYTISKQPKGKSHLF